MNAVELDHVYTALCHRMTALGQEKLELFLARLVLLTFSREIAHDKAIALIEDASAGLETFDASASHAGV